MRKINKIIDFEQFLKFQAEPLLKKSVRNLAFQEY